MTWIICRILLWQIVTMFLVAVICGSLGASEIRIAAAFLPVFVFLEFLNTYRSRKKQPTGQFIR